MWFQVSMLEIRTFSSSGARCQKFKKKNNFFWLYSVCSMWDLSSLTRDRTCTPCIEAWSHHWTTRGAPSITFLKAPQLTPVRSQDGVLWGMGGTLDLTLSWGAPDPCF